MNSNFILQVHQLNAWMDKMHIIKNVNLNIQPNTITAIIGPSGCGKSTFIRCLNRIHEETPKASVSGKVLIENQDIYQPNIDPVLIRRKVGMVFQKPLPFFSMSIFENVVIGLRLAGIQNRSILNEISEKILKEAALWNEVKDKLYTSGAHLSGGQQQRLCIARALAIQPIVLLMDEPTSALDPVSTIKIEELMMKLKKKMTLIVVTHNMQQAARISDQTVFFLNGKIVESQPTSQLFRFPKDKRTKHYLSGKWSKE